MKLNLIGISGALGDSCSSMVTQVRAAFAVSVVSEADVQTSEDQFDASISADRFICDGPGYLTKSGYGSLEVGAAED